MIEAALRTAGATRNLLSEALAALVEPGRAFVTERERRAGVNAGATPVREGGRAVAEIVVLEAGSPGRDVAVSNRPEVHRAISVASIRAAQARYWRGTTSIPGVVNTVAGAIRLMIRTTSAMTPFIAAITRRAGPTDVGVQPITMG